MQQGNSYKGFPDYKAPYLTGVLLWRHVNHESNTVINLDHVITPKPQKSRFKISSQTYVTWPLLRERNINEINFLNSPR